LKYDYGFGNNFLPVYHYGEDFHYLEFLLKEGFDYIGLGGVGAGDRLGQKGLRDWLKAVFFVNSDGRTLRYPGIKFHGFAMTSEETLDTVPLYSTDSATWVKNSAIGKILTPWGDYRVSNDPRSGYDVQHIKKATPRTRQKIRDWVESLDIEWDKLPDGRYEKHIVNTNFFKWMEQNHEWTPMTVVSNTLYSGLQAAGINLEARDKRQKQKLTFDRSQVKPIEEFSVKEVQPTPEKLVVTSDMEDNSPVPMFKPSTIQKSPVKEDISKPKLSLTVLKPKVVEHEPVVIQTTGPITDYGVSIKTTIDPQGVAHTESSAMFGITFACPHCFKPIEMKVKRGEL